MKNAFQFKILVVDDTPELLDIMSRALRKADYQIVTAKNGAECLQMLENEKPDILLLDVILPDVNGIELAKSIKNIPKYTSVYIILISSFRTSSEHISEGLENGADGYLVKPVENRELLARVASACRILTTERESKDAYEKYHALFSAMHEGVYLHEMIYDENGKAIDYRIIEANPASEKHLGIKPEQAVGKLATELYNLPKAPNLERYNQVTQTGNPVSFENHDVRMNKYIHISAYSAKNGRFATVFQDITNQKLADEKLRIKNEALQKTITEKDKFLSIIAHDLRSPFNGFLGLTRMIDEKLPTLSQAEIQEMVSNMRKSASNLFILLGNLLQWAQMQKGSIGFEPEQINLYPLIDNILTLEAGKAKAKNISIFLEVPANISVYADSNMLQSVIRNLLSNALKFTPRNGQIYISAEAGQNETTTLSVKDTGIGMDETMLLNLFRLDGNTSRKGTENEESTGLGLLLCKEFIEKHKGTIEVNSQVLNGSTFCITLPSNPASDTNTSIETTEKPVNEREFGKLKVLIAEDDPTSLMLLSITLKPVCSQILLMHTGTEAVETCKQNPDLDLVLMDIQLPGMNGYEATRQIRDFNKKVVIIAQTAFGLAGDKEKAMEAGCNDYIAKPVNIEALLGLIRKYFP